MFWLYYVVTLAIGLVTAKILFTSDQRQEQLLAGLFLLPVIWRLFLLI